MHVQILLFDGFDELDALAPWEVLRRAARLGADLQVELATLGGPREVEAAYGLRVHSQAGVAEQADLIIVPGGGWGDRAPRGAWAEYHRGEVPAAIARLYRAGATIASVCTGAMLVAKAGLAAGRCATRHQAAVDALRAEGVTMVGTRVVEDADLITAAGVTSGLELALWLVERTWGAEMAAAIERGLEYERRGTVWRRVPAGSDQPGSPRTTRWVAESSGQPAL